MLLTSVDANSVCFVQQQFQVMFFRMTDFFIASNEIQFYLMCFLLYSNNMQPW